MNQRKIWQALVVGAFAVLVSVSLAHASDVTFESRSCGGVLDGPDYGWWYGCSPTSAGMIMGYYDRNGYGTCSYADLVPGTVAEAHTYPGGSYHNGTSDMIAGPGHIADFYPGGGGASGDDVAPPWHEFNCVADFMGTSQDAAGNANGWTTFWYWTNGSRMYYQQIPGIGHIVDSGMYGMYEYLDYCDYDDDMVDLYNQYTDNLGLPFGFTLADYIAEIDAGRPVLIHVENHSMFGYGYDDQNPSTIFIRDTWVQGGQFNGGTMIWGGAYGGLGMYGVTVLELEDVSDELVPEPCTISLFALAVGAALLRKRRRAA